MKGEYGSGKMLSYTFEVAIEKVKGALTQEGLGIFTEIDMPVTVKRKLKKEIPPYLISRPCNLQLALQILEINASMGLLLPCNVVIRQDNLGSTHVDSMDPVGLEDKLKISQIAKEITQRLERVVAVLS
jgi:uncharacterized protein (DUF302 family)